MSGIRPTNGPSNIPQIPPKKTPKEPDGTEGSEVVQPTQPINPASPVRRNHGSEIASTNTSSNLGNQPRDGSGQQPLPKQQNFKQAQADQTESDTAAFLDLTPKGKEYQDALDAAGGDANHPDVVAKLKEIRARSSSGAYTLREIRPKAPEDS
jgi:hypothetical protein